MLSWVLIVEIGFVNSVYDFVEKKDNGSIDIFSHCRRRVCKASAVLTG